jgi:hypothetical protein
MRPPYRIPGRDDSREFKVFMGLLEEAQDRLHHGFVSRVSIDHGMVERTVGPVGMEVSLDERSTLTVNRIHSRFCIASAVTLQNQAPYFSSSEA